MIGKNLAEQVWHFNYSYLVSCCVNVSQSFKDFFVFEMLTEFFKGVFNEPQNLNEHGHITSLRFVSSLRLKQVAFHSQEDRVCSIHTFYESSRRTATMIKLINLFIYSLYGIRRMSTQHQSRLYRGESFFIIIFTVLR